jgi:hypothetical protein
MKIDGGPNDVGLSNSVAVELSSSYYSPRIAYYDNTAKKLKFAKYLGTVGNCGIDSSWVPRWYCQDVETIGDFPTAPSIAVTLSWNNDPIIVYDYYPDDHSPRIIREAIPNNWSNGNCGNNNWNCITLAAGGNSFVNEGESISMDRTSHSRVIVWDEYDDYYTNRAMRVLQDFEMNYLPIIKKN